MSDIIINKHLCLNNTNSVGVLSGPNLAREIAEEKVTGTVIASSDELLINDVKETFSHQILLRYIQV